MEVMGHITPTGKNAISMSMYLKGKNFLAAAMLLRKNNGYEYVVLHLLCQGIEITLKALLLRANYDKYKTKLRKYGRSGHDLVPLVADALEEFNLKPLKPNLESELSSLAALYSSHSLRYVSLYDVFVDPKSIKSDLVLRRTAALVRLSERAISNAE